MIPGATNLKIVLVSPRNPLNIGAAARAVSNFGFSCLRLVTPYEVAYREARSAVKASRILESAEEFPTVAEAIADCQTAIGTTAGTLRDLHSPLHRLEHGGRLIREELAAANVALLFGCEKFGLSRDDLSYCHRLIRIPTRKEHISMNLGQAVAVCLYELIRLDEAVSADMAVPQRAGSGAQERVSGLLADVLSRSGWLNPATEDSSGRKVRELVRRMNLTRKDAEVWYGMLRQIVWRFDHPEP